MNELKEIFFINDNFSRHWASSETMGFGMFDGEPDTRPTTPRPQQPPRKDRNTEDRRNRHKCPACRTLFKLWNGIRTCPCGHDGRNKQLVTDQVHKHLWVEDLDNNERMGEVAYARGLVDHPDYFTVPAMAATVHAARNCGVLLSPSITSSSEDENTADYDDDTPLHGFSPEADDTPELVSSEEDGPDTSATGYRRNSSTRYDALDDTATAPPHPFQGVPPNAPDAPPSPSATPSNSPLHFRMRSGLIKQGAPKKKGKGTRGRR